MEMIHIQIDERTKAAYTDIFQLFYIQSSSTTTFTLPLCAVQASSAIIPGA